jgi:hypothetical protein
MLSVNVYKAESLQMEGSDINPFVSVRAAGLVDRSDIKPGNQNPSWETNFKFPVF